MEIFQIEPKLVAIFVEINIVKFLKETWLRLTLFFIPINQFKFLLSNFSKAGFCVVNYYKLLHIASI